MEALEVEAVEMKAVEREKRRMDRYRGNRRARVLGILLALLGASCGGEVLEAEEEADDGVETATAVSDLDTWYFCVDHPCPDLAPLLNDHCYLVSNRLYVGVRNVGQVTAGASTTRVLFHSLATRYLSTPALLPNQTWTALVPVPSQCLPPNPGCSYNVRADYYDIVNETTGKNNSFSGACIH